MTPGAPTFRSWRSSDLAALVHHADSRNVWLQLRDRFPHPYTAPDGEDYIGRCQAHVGPALDFAIAVGGAAIGAVGMRRRDDVHRRTARIGYWLGEEFWGRGIGTAAACFITDYAFATFPLERVEAGVFEWNTASARVLEKAGFALEGRQVRAVCKAGRIGDLLLYAHLRPAGVPLVKEIEIDLPDSSADDDTDPD
jgi:RimJ/RimL family protein N-acetyltransferase